MRNYIDNSEELYQWDHFHSHLVDVRNNDSQSKSEFAGHHTHCDGGTPRHPRHLIGQWWHLAIHVVALVGAFECSKTPEDDK